MIAEIILLYFYRLLHAFIFILSQALYPFLNPKIQSILRQKNQNLLSNSSLQIDQNVIWIHAASGEFEYAKPVIREIKKKSPHSKILVTYFSVSFQKNIQNFPGVDYSEILPWDFNFCIRQLIRKYQPQALLIARTDVWPEMIYQTRKAKIPSLLFSATLSPSSFRHQWPFSIFIRWTLNQVSQIFVVAKKDHELFTRTKTRTPILIQGDTRYDQVLFRLSESQELKTILKPNHPTIIFGSTWIEDEEVIVPALSSLKAKFKIILAPHEPSLNHLTKLETELQKKGLSFVRYSKVNAWKDEDILIIDQVGILASLYLWSDFAFVGGSFKKQVHSVMEPLAAGNICLVGPYHQNNREAVEFIESNDVLVINNTQDLILGLEKINLSEVAENKIRLQQKVASKQGSTQSVLEWIPFRS